MLLRHILRWPQNLSGYRFCSVYKPIKRPGTGLSDSGSRKIPLPETPTHAQFLDALRMQIKALGPMTVADYMRRVLTNPAAGYYMHQDVFGSKGDYVTSPEINQVFGELISLWCLVEWEKVGSPSPVQLIELGPGRGTMIQDILRVMTKFDIQQSLSVHLVEVSPFLAKAQCGRLCYKQSEYSEEDPCYLQGETVSGIKIYWHKELKDVPLDFSIILAHEFFDALPIHKFQKDDGKWKEILIDVNEENSAEEQFRYVLCQNETAMSKVFTEIVSQEEQREHLEFSPEQQRISQEISNRLESHGGFALIMDYGHEGEKSDTFRSFKNHKLHSPLKDPGTADLTADVDFSQLKKHFNEAERCLTFGPVTQRDFIKGMGGDTRMEVLLSKAEGEQKDLLKSGYEMLVDKLQMGERFKFFSIYPKVLQDHLKKYPPTAFSKSENTTINE